MKTSRISKLLKQNPKARKHTESIKGALSDLDALRRNGFASEDPVLVSPYRGLSGISQFGSKPFKAQLKSYLRVTFSS